MRACTSLLHTRCKVEGGFSWSASVAGSKVTVQLTYETQQAVVVRTACPQRPHDNSRWPSPGCPPSASARRQPAKAAPTRSTQAACATTTHAHVTNEMACNSGSHTRRYARAYALPNIHGEGHNDRVVGVFNRRLYVETSVLQRLDKLTVCGQAYTADVAPRLRVVDARCRCADTVDWSERGATARKHIEASRQRTPSDQ